MYLNDIDFSSGSGASSSGSSIDWGGILSSVVQGYSQVQASKLQLQRAKQGLPPVDLSQYAAPPVRVQTTVAPGEGTNKTLMLAGGIGLAGLALFMLMGRRR